MNPDEIVSRHIADLDARVESELEALRERGREAKRRIESGVSTLRATAEPSGPLDGGFDEVPFEPHQLVTPNAAEPPYTIAPDEQIFVPDDEQHAGPALDDDGIPIWQDP